MTLEMIVAVASSFIIGLLGFLAKHALSTIREKMVEDRIFFGKAIDELWSALKEKADDVELTRARDAHKHMEEKIEKRDAEDRERHSQVMIQIGELKGMLNSLLLSKRGEER